MWTKLPTTFDFWEVEITFRVTGRARVGADGLVRATTNHTTLILIDYCHVIISIVI
jgi:hypothetical protein